MTLDVWRIALALACVSGCAGSPDAAPTTAKGAQTRQLSYYLPDGTPVIAFHFERICSMALNDQRAGKKLAEENGWKPFRDEPAGSLLRLGQRGFRDLDLFIKSGGDASLRAAECTIMGFEASPDAAAGLGGYRIVGYKITDKQMPSGFERRMEGTASFGDPIVVDVKASMGPGALTVILKMTNVAMVPETAKPQ
jgi:hypothetical protein